MDKEIKNFYKDIIENYKHMLDVQSQTIEELNSVIRGLIKPNIINEEE